jgi:N-acyl-D-amino-acid deacylase
MLNSTTKIHAAIVIATCLVITLAACSPTSDKAAVATTSVGQLFTGGLVYDGSGEKPYLADVGVSDGKIAFIGDAAVAGVVSDDTIDATGLWVAPGFIDAHSHAALEPDYGRAALPFLYQGITTVVLGVDGAGTSNVANEMQQWQDNGIGVNGLVFVGHGYVRRQVMGTEDRPPTPLEMQAMKTLVKKGMDEGAFGLSTGLFYIPGTYASTDEVVELAGIAANYKGAIYDTHDRDLGAVYQGVGYDASVKEAIHIGEESGLRVIFSHYNLQGAHNYGRADVGAKYVNEARDRGIDVWAAHHPYTATQSSLQPYTIPSWAAAGSHEEMLARFEDPELSAEIMAATNAMLEIRGGADKLLFVDSRPDLNGKTLAEIASERELSPSDAIRDILQDGNASVMNLELYDNNNTRVLAQEAWMLTCTDGVMPRPDQPITHPRTYGAFARKMRLFVFEEPVLTPEFAIRSYSGLAADFYRLPNRGYLREGYVADIAVLDPDRYTDKATYSEPRQFTEGVVHVLVNGTFALRDGDATNALAGVPLSRPNTVD